MSEMTPRERWLAILEKRKPDRVPTDYWCTGEFHAKLRQHLNVNDDETLYRRLHIDRPRSFWPHCKLTHHPHDPKAGIWGVRHRQITYGTGTYSEVEYSPLADFQHVEDLADFRWPSPDDYDLTAMTAALEKDDGYRIRQAGYYEPVLLYGAMRGLEKSYEDFLTDPDFAHAVLARIFDFHYELNRRIFEAGKGKIDMMYLAEDLGSQTGPLFSLDVYDRFVLPYQKKMADLARSHHVHVFYHTDGSARTFLPRLVNDVGIDVLNPLQWRCPGMEREGLVRDFGALIAFHGGIDNQQTLPFGSVQDVVNEVKDNLRIFQGSRWICAPCHNIQAVSPVQNVIAMYETIHELGKL